MAATRISSSTLALAVGVLGSAAANVAWTYQLGPVRVAAGLFATALVPVSLHLWPHVAVTGWFTRVIRALVMTYICLAAAVVNLAHSALLLTTDLAQPRPATEEFWLAVLLITAVEAVMVMATLAKRTRPVAKATPEQVALLVTLTRLANTKPRVAPKTQPRRDVSSPSPVVAAPKPVEGPVVVEPPAKVALHLAPAPAEGDRAAELIASGVGRKTLAVELGISEHAARELLKEARAQA